MKAGKVLFIALAAVCLTFSPHQVSAQNTSAQTSQAIVTPTPSAVPSEPTISPNGLQINGSKISFYKNGKMLKNSWLNYKEARYYFNENGYACRGTQRINNKVYVFDENGHLLKNHKNKMVTVFGKRFYIASNSGNPATGYFIYRNNLYYADSKGRCYQNRSRENGQLYFTANGSAKKNTDVLLKMKTMQTVASITSPKMNKAQKLRACWDYIVKWDNFNYGGNDPDRSKNGWYRNTALKMLQSKTGTCYSFACAFAALAKEVGYKNIKLIIGYDHCWLTINGKHYDPQAHWSGWIRNVYGLNTHPVGTDGVTVCDFMK